MPLLPTLGFESLSHRACGNGGIAIEVFPLARGFDSAQPPGLCQRQHFNRGAVLGWIVLCYNNVTATRYSGKALAVFHYAMHNMECQRCRRCMWVAKQRP